MKITLDQLKEIAKAGYGGTLSNFKMEGTYFEEGHLSRILKDGDCNYIFQIYHTNAFNADNQWYIRFDKTSKSFNHLAAIRKMEELGLIPK